MVGGARSKSRWSNKCTFNLWRVGLFLHRPPTQPICPHKQEALPEFKDTFLAMQKHSRWVQKMAGEGWGLWRAGE